MNKYLKNEFRRIDPFKEFMDWMKEAYPDIKLLPWQEAIAILIFERPIASGKSFLIKLLYEYKKEVN